MSGKKIAFMYSHGGPVFDERSHDGLNERGRNIVRSIKSAIDSGADMVFVSESVYPNARSQMKALAAKGLFRNYENKLDITEYPIAPNVKFPKNYLMDRGTQKASGFFGIVFSDSDVIFDKGFPQRAATELEKCDFLQPEYIMYTGPNGNDHAYLETSMKRNLNMEESMKFNLSYLEGMPGMVNIARREKFLEIGGFSQAISGVNFEDIEYQIRLKLLKQKTSFMHNEWCRHLHHSRSRISRTAENLPAMFFENSNFMNWWVDHYIMIRGNTYNSEHFAHYLAIIKHSLDSNAHLSGEYKNETGTITPEFNPNERYTGYTYGIAEPYVEEGTREEKIAAVINAARFWRLPYHIIINANPSKFQGIRPEEVEDFERKSHEEEHRTTHSEEEARKREEERKRAEEEQRRASEEMKKRLKDALRQVSDEDREKSHDIAVKMKALLRKKARSDL